MQSAIEYLKSYTNQNTLMLHSIKWNTVERYSVRLFGKSHWKTPQSRSEVRFV